MSTTLTDPLSPSAGKRHAQPAKSKERLSKSLSARRSLSIHKSSPASVLAANAAAHKQREEELERPSAAGVIHKDLRNCQQRAQDMHTCIR